MMSIQGTDNCVHLKKSVKVLVTQSCLTLCDPMDCSPQAPRPWESLGKNTGVGCHFLLQGIFPTPGSNPGLLHCRQILHCLSHQGSPQRKVWGISLVVQLLRLRAPNGGGMGSIPGWGTKIPCAVCPINK